MDDILNVDLPVGPSVLPGTTAQPVPVGSGSGSPQPVSGGGGDILAEEIQEEIEQIEEDAEQIAETVKEGEAAKESPIQIFGAVVQDVKEDLGGAKAAK